MPKVVHIVVTRSFAGVERYVAGVAEESASQGWDVIVVGGEESSMRRALEPDVRWLRGGTPSEALRSLARVGSCDICHVHMTFAEAVAVVGRPLHRAPIVATRHFAAPRGKTRLGSMVAPWLGSRLSRQVAVSEFVARSVERPPEAVLLSGARTGPVHWQPESRVVLVLQRLEPEKETMTALDAWRLSCLADEGWSLRIVGTGSERAGLERWTADHDVRGVTFAGWADDPAVELAGAGVLLAPGGTDSFGLAVVEAMVAGVPVVAAAGGGHLETIGLVPDAPLFAPGDAAAAGTALRALADDDARLAFSRAGRETALQRLTLAAHVDGLLSQYELVRGR
jgi:glycosyltransferase involved in cell wall biosynthesis